MVKLGGCCEGKIGGSCKVKRAGCCEAPLRKACARGCGVVGLRVEDLGFRG